MGDSLSGKFNDLLLWFSAHLQVENIDVKIFTLDPGGISGNSHLLNRTAVPTSVKLARQTRTGFGPLLRLFSKSSINNASVPAKVISKIAFQKDEPPDGQSRAERYFILNDEYEAGSVLNVLRDEKEMEDILRRTMHWVSLKLENISSHPL